MAHKFYQRYVQEGDITDPRDWTLNQQDLIEEFNGRLDRDNIDQSVVTTTMIKGNAFSIIRNVDHAEGAADVALEGGTIAWRSGDGTNTLGRIEVDLSSAALVWVWWSGYWEWTGGGFPSSISSISSVNTVRFRLTIDGIEVSRIHKSPGYRLFDCGFCVGSLAVDPGPHVIEVQAKMFIQPTNAAVQTAIFCTVKARDLVMWARRQ